MGIIISNKQIDAAQIDCSGTLKVTLSLNAAPNINTSPADILLVLDRSAAMAGAPLTNMQTAAYRIIDAVDGATVSGAAGAIGAGVRMGIVSFADTATVDAPLTANVADLKNAVGAIKTGGNSNPAAAFTTAAQSFDPVSLNAKVLVMFTNGNITGSTTVTAADNAAAAARTAGIAIYSVGVAGSDGINPQVLESWTNTPASAFTGILPADAASETLFPHLENNLAKAGATGIVVTETVNPDFEILCITPPTKGTATAETSSGLRWDIPSLGGTACEGATLEFCIRHIGTTSGYKPVNQEITYTDRQGNVVNFPKPYVQVDCGTVINPEHCPTPVTVSVEGCSDSAEVDVGDVYNESDGRIITVSATLKNICPGRRTAMAVMLTELDDDGNEHPRGLKTIVIPAHSGSSCRDVNLRNIRFIVPDCYGDEESGEYGENGEDCSHCRTRNYNVRVMSHSIDSTFMCHDNDDLATPPATDSCTCGTRNRR